MEMKQESNHWDSFNAEFDGDHSRLQTANKDSRRRRRRRRCRNRRGCHPSSPPPLAAAAAAAAAQVDSGILQGLMEEHRKFRKQIDQQQLEMNQMKAHIQQLRALTGKVYDGLDLVAGGFGAIQNRLGEIHRQRPGDGLRYRGL